MKINFHTKILLPNFVSLIILVSCGGGGDGKNTATNTEVSEGVIKGVVMLGPVSGATISVYQINPADGSIDKTTPIASPVALTDAGGLYTVNVKPAEVISPILICASGISANYSEPGASKTNLAAKKSFSESDELCAMTVFKQSDVAANKNIVVNISFFTHLAYGLFESKKSSLAVASVLDSGETLGLLNQANADVAAWLAIDSITTITPLEINNAVNTSDILTPEFRYGVALAGLSYSVDWLVSSGTRTQNFEAVSLIELAQLAFLDIKSTSGWLDGQTKIRQIKLFAIPLDVSFYRYILSSQILALINNRDINKTGLTIAAVKPLVTQLNSYSATLFNPASIVTNIELDTANVLSEAGLMIPGKLLTKTVNVSASISDYNGINSVLLTIYNIAASGKKSTATAIQDLRPEPLSAAQSKYIWQLDTTAIVNGDYIIELVARNQLNKTTTVSLAKITVTNKTVTLTIKQPSIATLGNPDNALSGLVTFGVEVFDPASNPTIVFDVIAGGAGSLTNASPKADIVAALSLATIGNGTPVVLTTGDVPIKTYHLNDIDVANLGNGKLGDGLFNFRAKATQNVTNPDPSVSNYSVKLRKFAVDSQMPSVAFNNVPDKFTIIATANLGFDTSVSDAPKAGSTYSSGVATASAQIDGQSIVANINKGIASFAVKNITPNKWIPVTLTVSDIAGNVHTSANVRNFAYDTKLPSFSLLTTVPANAANQWLNKLDISGTVTDGVGVQKLYYSFGVGSAPQGTITAAVNNRSQAFTFVIPAQDKARGDIIIVAEDSRGVKGQVTTSIAQVGFDNTAPLIAFSSISSPTASTATVLPDPAAAPSAANTYSVKIDITEDSFPSAASGVKSAILTASAGAETGITSNTNFDAIPVSATATVSNQYRVNYPTTVGAVAYTADVRQQWDYSVQANCNGMEDFVRLNVQPQIPEISFGASLDKGFQNGVGLAHPAYVTVSQATTAARVATNFYQVIPQAPTANDKYIYFNADALSTSVTHPGTTRYCYGKIDYGNVPTYGNVSVIFYWPNALKYFWSTLPSTAGTPQNKYYYVNALTGPNLPAVTIATATTELKVVAEDATLTSTATGNQNTQYWCMPTTIENSIVGSSLYQAKLPGAVSFIDAKDATKKNYLDTLAIAAPLPITVDVVNVLKPSAQQCWDLSSDSVLATDPQPDPTNALLRGAALSCGLYGTMSTAIDIVDNLLADNTSSGSQLANNYAVSFAIPTQSQTTCTP